MINFRTGYELDPAMIKIYEETEITNHIKNRINLKNDNFSKITKD